MKKSTINLLQLEQLCLEKIGLEIGSNQEEMPSYQRAVECEISFLLEVDASSGANKEILS